MTDNEAAKAEHLSERRARVLPVLACLLIAQQASYFSAGWGDRAVDHVRIAAWLVLSIVILLMLITGGGWIYPRRVRALANDEATRAHRDRAFRAGFVASMVACIAIYFLTFFEQVGARTAVHVVMTAGLAVTLMWFAVLERRAHASG